jgi:hypothetical protein
VTGIEHQLRDLLETAAGDPPRRVTAREVRRRTVRRRLAEYGTAALAAVLLAGLGVAISSQAAGPSPAPVSPSPAGLPRFYVVQVHHDGKSPITTEVRSTATGKVTGTVKCPGKESLTIGNIIAASHRTFFADCEGHNAGSTATVTGSQLWRFQVSGTGQVTGYSPVRGGALKGLMVTSMATTPDGSELAVAVSPPASKRAAPGNIIVISTRTGKRAVWHNAPDRPGSVQYLLSDLSLTADGHELVFHLLLRCRSGGSGQNCPLQHEQEVRAVRPAAAGGQLSSSRVLVLASLFTGLDNGYINNAVITPDGSAVTIFTEHTGGRSSVTSVLQASAATGKVVRVLYRVSTGNEFSFQYFNVDPSGRYLIMDTSGASGQSVNGWIYHGRLIPLKPRGGDAWYAAW